MSTVHSSIDHHPDLLALRASYDRAAESMSAHVIFGLALL
ncbi:MAG: SPW repeat protein, partial [Mycobacterium sp.]